MSFELTERAARESEKLSVEPQLVLEIEGISTLFGAVTINKLLKYGDTIDAVPVKYGDAGIVYGGLIPIDDQKSFITFDSKTSTGIKQQLRPDQGNISSVSNVTVSLIDKDELISQIISPGVTVTDILARKATLYFGFASSAFPDDYIRIFTGLVDDVTSGTGTIELNIAHPDQKKRQELFTRATTQLNGAIGSGDTTITVNSTSDFIAPTVGDPSLKHYVRIEDEVMRFTGLTATTFTGVTRGQLGTTAAAHVDDTDVESFFVLEGDMMTLALQLMLSLSGDFVTGVGIRNFVDVSPTLNVANSVFFEGIDVEDIYGLTINDFIEISGASEGANNTTDKVKILEFVKTDTGSYIVLNSVDESSTPVVLVSELDSAAVASFSSQYDVLAEGLAMDPQQVDVFQHQELRRVFLSSFDYRFYIKDQINAKDFINQQIYAPYAAYSLPRKGKASVGLHIGPLPTDLIKQINRNNITNAKNLQLRRTTTRNMYNTIIYKFDQRVLEDTFASVVATTDATSRTRIPIGTKALTVEATGIRSDLTGTANASTSTTRLLNRYKFGAEFFERIKLFFKDGFNAEVGDLVLFDFDQLKVTETVDGTREKESKLYEIINKSLNFKTGDISLNLVDTSFTGAERFAVISPASELVTVRDAQEFTLTSSFASRFGANEGRKWKNYVDAAVIVRNPDFSFKEAGVIGSVTGNTIRLQSALGLTPSAGMIMELDEYDNQPDNVKLVFGFMSDAVFGDGKAQYVMI